MTAHPNAVKPLETGDTLMTLAEIKPQNLKLAMPPVEIEQQVNDGDVIEVGSIEFEVWHTPGHTDSQLAFRVGDVLAQRRQHLSRRLHRRDRCPPRKRHQSLRSLAREDSGQRREMAGSAAMVRSSATTPNCSTGRSIG